MKVTRIIHGQEVEVTICPPGVAEGANPHAKPTSRYKVSKTSMNYAKARRDALKWKKKLKKGAILHRQLDKAHRDAVERDL